MEWPQIIGALLVGAGGAQGLAKAIKVLRPHPPPQLTVRQYRDSELGTIQFRLAEIHEHTITNAGTQARIEGLLRAFKSRLDDMDVLIARLIDNYRELSQGHRDLIHRVERLEERDGPR